MPSLGIYVSSYDNENAVKEANGDLPMANILYHRFCKLNAFLMISKTTWHLKDTLISLKKCQFLIFLGTAFSHACDRCIAKHALAGTAEIYITEKIFQAGIVDICLTHLGEYSGSKFG